MDEQELLKIEAGVNNAITKRGTHKMLEDMQALIAEVRRLRGNTAGGLRESRPEYFD